MTNDELIAAIERSGLSREEIQGMSRDEVARYYSTDNYRNMFGDAETPDVGEMEQTLDYAQTIRESSPEWTPSQIRRLRERLGLTQEQAAHRCGVTYSTWSKWEGGARRPNSYAAIIGLRHLSADEPQQEDLHN